MRSYSENKTNTKTRVSGLVKSKAFPKVERTEPSTTWLRAQGHWTENQKKFRVTDVNKEQHPNTKTDSYLKKTQRSKHTQ